MFVGKRREEGEGLGGQTELPLFFSGSQADSPVKRPFIRSILARGPERSLCAAHQTGVHDADLGRLSARRTRWHTGPDSL